MNEDFVAFDLAKKLKEKGFNKECFAHYDDLGNLLFDKDYWKLDSHILAPTISQVLKWLREEKKLHIELWVTGKRSIKWHNTIHTLNHTGECKGWSSKEESKSYEQAALAGIEYTLDNLI